MSAAYIAAHASGLLGKRVKASLKWLARCTLCPRLCRVDRLSGERGRCRTGRRAVVASFGPHFGEEASLVGRGGSGTIFFSHCNLFCTFCQNEATSHGGEGVETTPEDLAAIMVRLERSGCENINLVTPTHVLPQILEALPLAVEAGLSVPLVWNCGGYERVSALRLLSGIVDIFMPDFKFWGAAPAAAFCDAPDYPERAGAALREMHRQVGDLALDARGVAGRGLLVRHLVMPGELAGTSGVARFIADELSPATYVNVMDQYRPCGAALRDPRINRRVTEGEYARAVAEAQAAGLTRLDGPRPRPWRIF